MSVLALMYHATPRQPMGDSLAVPLPLFRDHMTRLIDAGCEFVRFGDLLDPTYYSRGKRYVSVTFDDGDESNLEALDFLHGVGVVPTAFIVSAWSQQGKRGCMSATAIAERGSRCDFGGHGATHRPLSSLSQPELENELHASKSFLEDTLRRTITTMAAPGGHIDDRVAGAARRCGFRILGTSVELDNQRPSSMVNRVCVHSYHTPEHLLALWRASALFWMRQRLRRSVLNTAVRCLGDSRYAALKRLIAR
jgi:peptidoglycan/xylan/chitin deacetylase (PgdA/CDA1 family)